MNFYPQENTHSERKDRNAAQISNADGTYPLGLSLMNEKEKKATAWYQQLYTLFQEMFLFFCLSIYFSFLRSLINWRRTAAAIIYHFLLKIRFYGHFFSGRLL